MSRRVLVFGPAYLDRVLRVDRPLVDPALGGPLDQSVDGDRRGGDGPALLLADPVGGTIEVVLPPGWPGPTGEVRLSRPMVAGAAPWRREVAADAWLDDLGGMGAGFAAALGGELVSALGPEGDPTSRAVASLLGRARIAHRPIRLPGREADWTLLVTSGGFGDKLPIGFRGCHAALRPSDLPAAGPCDLLAVAALPNPLAAAALRSTEAALRFFAPALRNMIDREHPLPDFAASVDLLSCNRGEWEALERRDEVAAAVPIVAITDGPRGSLVRFRGPGGGPAEVAVPAFPRRHPPRDTNRAGEAYSATLISTLLDAGWAPGPADANLIRRAARRAAAAAALVLDLGEFGFPTPAAVDDALRAGIVG